MEKYIALLRGINVGGNRPVPMAALKSLFEENGFENVSTYIQSGSGLTQQELMFIWRSCVPVDRYP